MFTKTDIDNYFISYRHEHLFLLVLAAVAIVTASILYSAWKKDFYKGIAISLVSFAILFFTTSFNEYKKANRLRVINVYNYDMHPEYLKGKELKRIATLKKTITIEFSLSIGLVVVGIALYFYSAKKVHASYLRGVALGMFIMAGFAAATFFVVQKNLLKYEEGVVEFTKEIFV